jgi:hypothetical protein
VAVCRIALVLLLVGVAAEPTRIGLWAQRSTANYSFEGLNDPWALAFSALVEQNWYIGWVPAVSLGPEPVFSLSVVLEVTQRDAF